MSLSSTSLPKPKNWQDFERSTRVLFECVLGDPNTQMNGRTGQSQNGVDVYGQRENKYWVGVQCKEKYTDNISDTELRTEVEKAKAFKPVVSEYYMVTTAPRDQKIQTTARLITKELSKTDHPIKVIVWGWDDIEEHASNYEKAIKAFDPTCNPFVEKGFDILNDKMDEMRQLLSEVHRSSVTENIKTDENNEETHLHGQITILQKLINDGNVQLAYEQLLQLKEQRWEGASASERYRILVSIASAKHKLGYSEEAGQLLIEAYKEFPEHKDSGQNLATGYLLSNDNKNAAEYAKNTLAKEEANSHLANILIHARISEASCKDPLDGIPIGIQDSEEVLIALIQFYRSRNNQCWIDMARKANKKYPNSDIIKTQYAEGILESIVRFEQDAKAGGVLQTVSTNEFNSAVEILYSEAVKAIKVYSEFLKTIVYNAALALRLKSDYSRAKEILDKAIEKYTTDENLRLQRSIIAHLEKDTKTILEILPKDSINPEIISMRVGALIDTNFHDAALTLIDSINESAMPEHVVFGLLFDRLTIYAKKGLKQKAIDTISKKLEMEPDNLQYRILEIKTYRLIGNKQVAENSFNKALGLVSDATNLHLRIELSFEARAFNRNDEIVALLKNHVSNNHDNEGLRMLISALINSGQWHTCRELLDSISVDIKEIQWIQRAEIVLALATGEMYAKEKMDNYLANYPSDLDIVLARIGFYQREEENEEIRKYIQSIDLAKLEGVPEQFIRLASLISFYSDTYKGVDFGYSILMNNWTDPLAHLAYQSLILLNDNLEPHLPSCETVKEDTVVGLFNEKKVFRYRLENSKYSFHEDERIPSDNEIYGLLMDKKIGEEISLRKGAKPVKIGWIKPKYIDALHQSFEYFEEHFPNSEGMMRFSVNVEDENPSMKDIIEIMRARSETSIKLLDMYKSNGFPLAFVAKFSGNDLIDTWKVLNSLNYKFLVCQGSAIERVVAHQNIVNNVKRGCIIDAITLSLIRQLDIKNIVSAVCGQIYIPQSVMDYLSSRHILAEQNIGKQMGVMAWQNNRLEYEDYNQERLNDIASEYKKEIVWAKENAQITSSSPKLDLSKEDLLLKEKLGNDICDTAFAAIGNKCLLLSEDMGYRKWALERFHLPVTWLQPILEEALSNQIISNEEYYEIVDRLVFLGHTFVYLNSDCLMYQARKDKFILTKRLTKLLEMTGGSKADFKNNTNVLSEFINKLLRECSNESKNKRILAEIFRTFSDGRTEDLRLIVFFITEGVGFKRRFILNYSIDWLIGHSIGMPYFEDLINYKKRIDKQY